ncbi:MAG: adhesin [Hyphomicrobium sp.]
MFAYQAGRSAAVAVCGSLARPAAYAALLALAGCASNQPYASQDAVMSARIAQAAVKEIEDDGLPVQTPPPARIRDLADEPNEPFSRNYGGPNPSAIPSARPKGPAPMPANLPGPVVPDDLPPVFRQKILAAMTDET